VLRLRALTGEEAAAIKRQAQSRTAAARAVERARIIWLASRGERVAAIARQLDITEATARLWLKRFNTEGLAGLADRPRSGAPPTYSPEQVGEVVATSLTNPSTLGLPFGCWTLDRLAAHLSAARGVAMKRSRIGAILAAEGLRWRAQETWFGERVDPAFAEKRGRSRRSTPRHLRVVR
jgi:transposase